MQWWQVLIFAVVVFALVEVAGSEPMIWYAAFSGFVLGYLLCLAINRK